MAVTKVSVQDEVFEFLLSMPNIDQVAEYRISDAAQDRIRYLLDANRNNRLSDDERNELEELSEIEHFMTMLKIYALKAGRVRDSPLQKRGS